MVGKNRDKVLILILAGLLILLVPGCTDKGQPPASTGQSLRFVSLAPSFTEICFAIGLENNLVGVSDFCNYPPEARKIAKVGGIVNPDYERLMALKPDFVLLQDTQKEIIRKLDGLGMATIVIKADTVEDVLQSFDTIGEAAGKKNQAHRLKSSIENSLKKVREAARGRKPLKTLIVIGHEPGSLREIWAAAKSSFLDQLLTMAGGINCVRENTPAFPKISKEKILEESPESIIILTGKNKLPVDALERERKLWRELSYIDAVRNNRICQFEGDWMLVPGPRMPMIAERFLKCLHPDAGLR